MSTTIPTARVLRRLLASGVLVRAERLLERVHPADLGPLLADLTPDEVQRLLRAYGFPVAPSRTAATDAEDYRHSPTFNRGFPFTASLFVARPGTQDDGSRYIADADYALGDVSVVNPGLVEYNMFYFTLETRFF